MIVSTCSSIQALTHKYYMHIQSAWHSSLYPSMIMLVLTIHLFLVFFFLSVLLTKPWILVVTDVKNAGDIDISGNLSMF